VKETLLLQFKQMRQSTQTLCSIILYVFSITCDIKSWWLSLNLCAESTKLASWQIQRWWSKWWHTSDCQPLSQSQ